MPSQHTASTEKSQASPGAQLCQLCIDLFTNYKTSLFSRLCDTYTGAASSFIFDPAPHKKFLKETFLDVLGSLKNSQTLDLDWEIILIYKPLDFALAYAASQVNRYHATPLYNIRQLLALPE